MKRLIAASSALAIAVAAPAAAQTVLPTIAAMRYCDLRRLGVGQVDALRAAGNYGYSSEPPTMVMYRGVPTDANALLFSQQIYEICPREFMSEPIPKP